MRSDDEGARSSSTACRRRHQATASNKRLSARSASGVPNTAATSSGGSDAPFRLSRAGHDGVSGPDDAYATTTFWERRGRAITDNHCLAYSNGGSIVSPSFVPPGSTILLSGSNLRLSYRTTTMWVPSPRKPPIDRTA